MTRSRRTAGPRRLVAVAAGLLLMGSKPLAGQTIHSIMPIDPSSLGGAHVTPWAINNLGRVVGTYESGDGTERAFFWTGGVIVDLSPSTSGAMAAYGINDFGEVVGEAEDLDGDVIAFRLWPGSPLVLLTVFDGDAIGGFESTAQDINYDGAITGWGYANTEFGLSRRAFLMDGFFSTELGSLGGFNSFGFALNDLALVVGDASSSFPNLIDRAFVWAPGTGMTQLDVATSQALDINYVGEAVGWQLSGGGQAARLWTLDGQTPQETVLPALPGDPESIARAINDSGLAVGSSYGGPSGGRAVLWDAEGINDLNDLLPSGSGWVLKQAMAINDLGQITGMGTLDGEPRGYVLSPLAVETIDPVPALLDGPAVTTDTERLGAAVGPRVVGLIADGVTQVLLRIPGLPGPGTVELWIADEFGDPATVGVLRTPGNDEDATTLSVSTDALADGRHQAFALLVAPENFIRGSLDHGEPFRPITLNVVYTPVGPGDVLATARTLMLHRPPIMLIHGLWSHGETWEPWEPSGPELDNDFTVYKHDYSATSGDSFLHNVVEPKVGVSATLELARERRLAATQVDVVAHSMGGVLTRLYVSEYFPMPEVAYIRDDNFFEGDINRLITMGTPHQGSPVADLLIALALSDSIVAQKAAQVAGSVGGCVDCGAVYDLQTTGLIINSLGAANVPAHAVAGTGGADYVEALTDIAEEHAGIWGTAIAWGIPPELIFPAGSEHDLLVSQQSAEGGLPAGTGVITLIPNMPSVTQGIHGDLTKDVFILETVIDLLNTPVTDTTTYAAGFPPAGGGAAAALADFPLPEYGDIVSGIVITNPAPGTLVNPGDVVTVTVEPIDGFVPAHVLVASRLDTDLDDTAPFTVDLVVPVEANGTLTLSAFAFDVGLNLAVAEEVEVLIDVPAALTAIRFGQDPDYLSDLRPLLQAHVIGTYDDGVEREVTDPALGTAFASLDPLVATVDADGVVSAVSVGQATIEATNGAHAATLTVFVGSLPCPGDIDRDGVVGINDFLDLLAAWGPCLDPPAPCGADLDADDTVGINDFLILLAHWGPCP